MGIPANFQRGDKQRSRGKGAAVITTSLQLQKFSHALFRQARGEDGVGLRSQHATQWDMLAKPGLPGAWAAPLLPFLHSFALIFPIPTPPHMLPAYIPYTSTTFCLGTSPQPSLETHTLARIPGRQSSVNFPYQRHNLGISILSPDASFHLILQDFVSVRPLLSLPGVGDFTSQALLGEEGSAGAGIQPLLGKQNHEITPLWRTTLVNKYQ